MESKRVSWTCRSCRTENALRNLRCQCCGGTEVDLASKESYRTVVPTEKGSITQASAPEKDESHYDSIDEPSGGASHSNTYALGPVGWIAGLIASVVLLIVSAVTYSPVGLVLSFIGAIVCGVFIRPHFETDHQHVRTYSVWQSSVIPGHTGCGVVIGIVLITVAVIVAFFSFYVGLALFAIGMIPIVHRE